MLNRHLLQGESLALHHLDGELLPDETRLIDHPSRNRLQLALHKCTRSRRLSQVNVRLKRAHKQMNAIVADDLSR